MGDFAQIVPLKITIVVLNYSLVIFGRFSQVIQILMTSIVVLNWLSVRPTYVSHTLLSFRFIQGSHSSFGSCTFVICVDIRFAVVVMFLEFYFIVAISDLFDVFYTAAADLNGISVEYLPKIVACWETVVDRVEEFFANVSIYIFTEREVLP